MSNSIYYRIMGLAALVLLSPLSAQDQRAALRAAQVAQMKKGNDGAALQSIRDNLDRALNAAPVPIQVAGELMALSSQLNGERDAVTASRAAGYAITILAEGRPQLAGTFAGSAAAMEGQIYDHLLGDRTKAIAAYERALVANPNDRLVRERLNHLRAAEANIRQRNEANELLRRRATNRPRS